MRPPTSRRLISMLGLVSVALMGGVLVETGCVAAPPHRGPTTAHFDGNRFHNQLKVPDKSMGDLLRWWWHREPDPWEDRTDQRPATRPTRGVQRPGQLKVTFVNHSTVLLQVQGMNILTDPVYSPRVGPVSWAGPKRHRQPGVPYDALPPIQLVLISHNHYDHLDLPTLRRLHRDHAPQVVVPLGNARLLEDSGVSGVQELDWWQSVEIQGVPVTLVPARHWSGRGLSDRFKTLWGGYVLRAPGGAIYFAGDTGWGPHFAQIQERFGPIRLAMLPIGAYEPRWFMRAAHINPQEAVRAHRVLRAATSVAIHHGTFRLSDEGQDEPPRALRRALRRAGLLGVRFWVLEHGETRAVPALAEVTEQPDPAVRAPRPLPPPSAMRQAGRGAGFEAVR